MQAKGLVKLLSITLAIVSCYYLINTWYCSNVENEAQAYAEAKYANELSDPAKKDSIFKLIKSTKYFYLDSMTNEPLFMGRTYKQCRETKLNLGLDLQGGMSLTLQVSLIDVIKRLSNNSRSPVLNNVIRVTNEKQKASGDDYLTLFGKVWLEEEPETPMAELFSTRDNYEKINPETDHNTVLSYLKDQANDAILNTENVIKTRIDKFGVIQPNIYRSPGSDRIYVELAGIDNPEKIKKILQSSAKLEFWECYENREFINNMVAVDKVILKKNKALMGLNEVDSIAKEEPKEAVTDNITADADTTEEIDDLLKDFEEEGDTSELDNIEESTPSLFTYLFPSVSREGQVFKGPVVGNALIKDTSIVNQYLKSKESKEFLKNVKLLWGAKASDNGYLSLYAIKERSNQKAALDGDVINDVEIQYENGKAGVRMVMNSEGAKKWKKITAIASKDPNNKQSIAVVLDDRVYSAPTVQEEIPNGISSITGNFTTDEANDLILILKNGKLPAKTLIIEEDIIGPSLGKASINSGTTSLIFGLIIVLVFMIFYYSKAGAVSDLALIINILFILGILAAFNATLTLPGIAGLVLTIGMSVDANVIIFERIREELLKGEGLKAAIRNGFDKSYSAIIDANITTLLTGFILLYFGTGPIKGFATVLIVGIFCAFLTAVLITRLILEILLTRDDPISFYNNVTVNMFNNTKVKFVGKRYLAYGISAIIISLGVASMMSKGFELGVDFNGGRSYIVRFDQEVQTENISKALKAQFENQVPIVKSFGDNDQVKITTSYMVEDNSIETDELIKSKLFEGLKPLYNKDISKEDFFNDDEKKSLGLFQSEMVGPTIADDFQRSASRATIIGLLVIFLYILFRFKSWQYGLGAVFAVIHDVFIVLSLFSIFKGILPFSLEIDQAFIAALLTIIGYSINDTVVIFDRIREFIAERKTSDFKTVINSAINNTLSRTLMTSLTTFIVVIILFIFGGEVIRGFAFALLIGIISGTYSSIFIATPTVVDLTKDSIKK